MKKRTYQQLCSLAKALDVIGERWTLLIIRELLLEPRRFSEIQTGLPGITTNLLTKRLKEMEATGLIEKVRLSSTKAGKAYALTERGRELETVIFAIGNWGEKHWLIPAPDDVTNPRWTMVAFKRKYRGSSQPWLVELSWGEQVFQMRLGSQALDIQEGAHWTPDLRVQVSLKGIPQLLFFGESAESLQASGDLRWTGTETAFVDWLTCFGLA